MSDQETPESKPKDPTFTVEFPQSGVSDDIDAGAITKDEADRAVEELTED